MKNYKKNTKFNFGKYNGKTLVEVFAIQPSYIDWCLHTIKHFIIEEDVLADLQSIKKWFTLSPAAMTKMKEKLAIRESERDNCDDYDDSFFKSRRYSDYELENGDWNYDVMNPSHNQSENPWIDVFGPGDEAAAAYWNMD